MGDDEFNQFFNDLFGETFTNEELGTTGLGEMTRRSLTDQYAQQYKKQLSEDKQQLKDFTKQAEGYYYDPAENIALINAEIERLEGLARSTSGKKFRNASGQVGTQRELVGQEIFKLYDKKKELASNMQKSAATQQDFRSTLRTSVASQGAEAQGLQGGRGSRTISKRGRSGIQSTIARL